eukprot:TRINITY_DN1869_c0_g1_i14.p4 TRINITY_DN1869_c0_g1~~TRINITY_DN1869_c0_g1_i14.p4  ORF type:complete len:134 (+),score=31.91 TRINITY_DN1869_c0_g1_i14:854-1255(+)
MEFTENKGVDVILDCVGPNYFEQSGKVIKMDGRWVIYGLLGGPKIENLNFGEIFRKRVSLTTTTLRNRSDDYKSQLVNEFKAIALTGFKLGILKPVVEKVYSVDWKDIETVKEAHTVMESNKNIGKLVLSFKN